MLQSNQFLILIPMIAGSIYHIGQKNLNLDINPFLVFFITYLLGSLLMLVLYFFNTQLWTIKIPALNLQSIISMAMITIGFMGIEIGFLLVYRSGLAISNSAFISSLGTSLILLFVGIIFFKEMINLKQFVGIVFAFIGMWLLAK